MAALLNLPSWSLYVLPAFIFLITVVVFFHELGHFAVARFFGVKVETFSIGFGRGIVKWQDRHGTQWKIGWIPLGGYVKFLGDADGASTPDRDAAARMSTEERAVAFPFKPVWQRALIVAAGPIANFILAVVILSAMFMAHGAVTVPPVAGKIAKGSVAAAAGIHTGDRILSVDGRSIDSFLEFQQVVSVSVGVPLPIGLERGGKQLLIWATPRQKIVIDQFKNRQMLGDLGIDPPGPPVIETVEQGSAAARAGIRPGDCFVSIAGHPIEGLDDVQSIVSVSAGKDLAIVLLRDGRQLTVHATPQLNDQKKGRLGIAFRLPRTVQTLGPIAAVGAAIGEIRDIIDTTFRGLFRSPEGIHQVSGIIGIGKVAGQAASVSFLNLIELAALLSVSIGLVNLFPIPLLDGGHLLYYAVEGVLGRPLGERAQDLGFRVGLAVVLGMFLLATFNDLLNLF